MAREIVVLFLDMPPAPLGENHSPAVRIDCRRDHPGMLGVRSIDGNPLLETCP
ncbi:MAG TPA: hypothetical protein VFJ93_11210 [Gaiellaceae bacterium]|nr:hypothetical protein [Gaiellaceae bacterium]